MAGPAPQSSILMHPYLLHLTPAHWGELYFGQFEALDLINCLISPLFFSSMLSRWPTPQDLLSLVYGTVLALKGYQLMLLLMPAARKRHAHKKARYWIILAERILRQWVASPLLGRGPRFVHYLHSTAAANPGAWTTVKLALIVSGIIHSTWNVFCLPLDFVSQVVITLVFFAINTSSALCQMAYPVAMLVHRWPNLVWGQWALEAVAPAAVSPLWHLLGGAGVDPATGRQTAVGCDAADGQGVCDLQDAAAQLTAAQLVSLPPGLAPDVDTLAGRWVLAASMAVLLLTVLYLPLLFAWRLELHYKARFLVHAVRRSRGGIRAQLPGGPVVWQHHAQQEAAASGACCAAPSPPASPSCLALEGSREAGAGGWAGGKQCKAAPVSQGCSSGKGEGADAECSIDGQQAQGTCSCACCAAGSSAGSSKGGRLVQPGSYPVLPPLSWASAKHLCAAVLACLLLGEGFVALCIVSPAVKGMLWPQIPMAPAP